MRQGTQRLFPAALLLICSSATASAGVFFYSGNLRTDATVTDCGPACVLGASDGDIDYAQWAAVLFPFTVTDPGPVQAITYGFGGGTSLQGFGVASGGLEPYLSLFDAGGGLVASTWSGVCPPGANLFGGHCYDVLLDAGVLAAGSYTLALTAFDNYSFAENLGVGTLSDGFTGLGNLASDENLNYAFDLTLPSRSSDVPEPGVGALLLVSAPAFLLIRRLRKDKDKR